MDLTQVRLVADPCECRMQISDFNRLSVGANSAWQQFNDTSSSFDTTPIIEQFYSAAERYADHIAISTPRQDVTYVQLRLWVNQISHHLRAEGVMPGDLVAITTERTAQFYVAVLGVIACGAAYLPIETMWPRSRTDYILRQSRARIVIDVATFDFTCLGRYPTANVDFRPVGDHPVYCLFTSGTTGWPKGVVVGELALLNLIDWCRSIHDINMASRVAQNAPATFDASCQQLFPALTAGATLYPVPLEARIQPNVLLEFLRDRQVTHLDIVPSHFQQLTVAAEAPGATAVELPKLEWVIIGGETLDAEMVERWRRCVRTSAKIDHVYGPTEATVNATYMVVDGALQPGRLPIGRPLPNNRLYVLDRDGNLCPPGMVGELCIGGIGLAVGYLNDELTQQAFFPGAPASSIQERLYRTGDRARLAVTPKARPLLEFAGREDGQVKLQGRRIELEEIESIGRELLGIRSFGAVVVGADSPRLVGLYVSDDVTSESLREHLASRLPEYMIPVALIAVARLPLLQNGKLDRRGLQTYYNEATQSKVPTPSSTEVKLAETIKAIWRQLLGVHNIGLHDNFFQLGGDSFKSMAFMYQLEAATGQHYHLSELYAHPTVDKLVVLIKQRQRASDGPPAPQSTLMVAPPTQMILRDLTPLARRSIRLGQSDAYAVSVGLRFDAAVDPPNLADRLRQIVSRHPLLRSYVEDGRFIELPAERFPTPLLDAQGHRPANPRIPHAEPPLFRWQLDRLAQNGWQFIWTMNHLIADGQSRQLLLRELFTASDLPAQPPDRFLDALRDQLFEAPLLAQERFVSHAELLASFLDDATIRSPVLQTERITTSRLVGVIEAIGLCAAAVSAWWGHALVPLVVYHHGRVLGPQQFFDTVGDFTDRVPLLVPASGPWDEALAPLITHDWHYVGLLENLLAADPGHELASRLDRVLDRLCINPGLVPAGPGLLPPNVSLIEPIETYRSERHGSLDLVLQVESDGITINLYAYGLDERIVARLVSCLRDVCR